MQRSVFLDVTSTEPLNVELLVGFVLNSANTCSLEITHVLGGGDNIYPWEALILFASLCI